MFGNWVRRRRNLLNLTQQELAEKVNCSLSMLRKIERDLRRPSELLAGLLADQLVIDDSQREIFLQLARGAFIQDIDEIIDADDIHLPLAAFADHDEDETPFVAREPQLHQLHDQLKMAIQGQGRMVFIAGETGQGKTSLLFEFARQAMNAQPDLIVAGGSSDVYTGQGNPLLPFRDIFRMLIGDIENVGMQGIIDRELVSRLERTTALTTEILLDHGTHLIDTLISVAALEARLGRAKSNDPKITKLILRLQALRVRQSSSLSTELRQDRLFEEISSTLKTLAHKQNLLLLLDDLHWVDQSSAALLGHLAMRLKQSPILIVGSYRPEDLAPRQFSSQVGGQAQHPLQQVLGESMRQFGQNRIDLDHSVPGESLAFVNELLDKSPNDFGEKFRVQLADLTEGHPLYVVELLRDMRERGDIYQEVDGRWKERELLNWENLPARVEGVVEKRITRLSGDLRELLNIASVQGETFFSEVIARVKQGDPREMTRRLSASLDRQHRLIQARGIMHAGTQRISQYRFQHNLFQKYLYGRLAAAERMYLHESVGVALEGLYEDLPSTGDIPAAQLARHFQEARLGIKAGKYLLLAGNQAARLLAFDEAAIHFEHGLVELQDLDTTSEINHLKYELQLALARALWHSGRVIEAIKTFPRAIEIARNMNDPIALAHAVLAYEEPRWRLNLEAQTSQEYIRTALATLDEEQSGLRVRLLVSLSRCLLASGNQEELRTTVEQALLIAHQINDPLALCDALRIKAQIDRRPENTADRLEAVKEMIAVAESIGDQERLLDALDLYVYDLLELGQIERVDRIIQRQSRVAQEIRQPFQLHVAAVFQTMRAIMDGKFKKAELLANEAADISRQIGIAEMDGIFGMHMFTIRREQGRIHEVAPIMKMLVETNSESSAWQPGLALIYSILDQREACEAVVKDILLDSFGFLPQDSLWVSTLAYLSEVNDYLGDFDRASVLYKLLLPYDGRTVVVGGATACFGAVSRYLGILAKTMGDWESAEGHLQEAIKLDESIGAWPWLAHSQCEYAAVLLTVEPEQNRERANALLKEALSAANRMGMVYLAEKVANLKGQYEIKES